MVCLNQPSQKFLYIYKSITNLYLRLLPSHHFEGSPPTNIKAKRMMSRNSTKMKQTSLMKIPRSMNVTRMMPRNSTKLRQSSQVKIPRNMNVTRMMKPRSLTKLKRIPQLKILRILTMLPDGLCWLGLCCHHPGPPLISPCLLLRLGPTSNYCPGTKTVMGKWINDFLGMLSL